MTTIEIIARVEDRVHTVLIEDGTLYAEKPMAEVLWRVLASATHPSIEIIDHDDPSRMRGS